jgi:hypothetical protein
MIRSLDQAGPRRDRRHPGIMNDTGNPVHAFRERPRPRSRGMLLEHAAKKWQRFFAKGML